MMLTTTSTKYRFMKIELGYVICQPFQPVVLLLSFHVAATGEDNQTDDPLLEMAFLYSASVGPPFHWCYIQHCQVILYSVQREHNGTRSIEKLYAPPTTCNSATSHWHADRPLYNIYTHEYFHWIRRLYMCTQLQQFVSRNQTKCVHITEVHYVTMIITTHIQYRY